MMERCFLLSKKQQLVILKNWPVVFTAQKSKDVKTSNIHLKYQSSTTRVAKIQEFKENLSLNRVESMTEWRFSLFGD